MRVNLGTIEVTDDERRALAAWFGEPGLASRKDIRKWALTTLDGAWADIGPPESEE